MRTPHISTVSYERLAGRLVAASLSGGKDSTALALLLKDLQIPHVRVFADTGFEAPETYEYLDVLRARLGPISVVRNESYWKDALPGEEGMLTLIRHKRMFPSRLMRFCTQKLKLHPIRDFVRTLVEDRGEEVVNAVGVRAAESAARAAMAEWEFWDDMDVDIWRPLIRWSEQDVIDMHHRHGLAPNPLYLAGARRVGCNPCIHASKSDLRRLREGQLVKIRRVERDLTEDAVARDCDRPTRAFFQIRGEGGGLRFTPIDDVVRLAHVHRGRPVVSEAESRDHRLASISAGLSQLPDQRARSRASARRWRYHRLPSTKPASVASRALNRKKLRVEEPRPVITGDELGRLGVSAEVIARYCSEGILRQVGEASYERTAELDRRLTERCNVGRGYLLAVGVTPVTIAGWLRRRVLVRGQSRGFYTMSRAAFESVRAAARGTGLPRELEGVLDAEQGGAAQSPAPEPARPNPASEIVPGPIQRPTSEVVASPTEPVPGSTQPPAETVEVAAVTPPTQAERLRVVPCTISRARTFVDAHHRHLPAPLSGLFAVGLAQGDALVGVAIVGRPVARALQNGRTAEVTRVCTLGHPNACSKLLGACRRVARSLGYVRLISYTLESEPGTSLRAAGWHETGSVRARSWDCPSRPRASTPTGGKRRWEVSLTHGQAAAPGLAQEVA